jgi:hypothetical protein
MHSNWNSGQHQAVQKQMNLSFESHELKAAERFFEWALSYERKGLNLAADVLREEGRKALQNFLDPENRIPG